MAFPRNLLLTSAALLLTSACFKGDDGSDEVADDTDTDTGESNTTEEDSTTEALPQAPVIDSFTVAGSETPDVFAAAGAVEVEVEASDADGEIAEVRIYRDDQLLATIPGPGPYVAEFVVTGESFDGTYEFSAVAIDDDDLEAEAGPISLTVDVPNGGVVETWTFDSGGEDSAYRVVVNPDGTEVIAGGTSFLNGENRSRIDRLVGGSWTDKVDATAQMAAGLTKLPDDTTVMLAWSVDDSYSSLRFRYDETGKQVAMQQAHWTPPEVPEANWEALVDAVSDAEGNVYAVGVYTHDEGDDAMMLLSLAPDGSVNWARYGIDPMVFSGRPYSIKLDIAGDDLVVGGQMRGMVDMVAVQRMWMSRWNTAGELLDQIELPDFEGYGWAVGIGDNGETMLGGQRFIPNSDAQSWVGRFGANGELLWIKDDGNPGIGATVAADIDASNASVVVHLEACESGFLSLVGCDMFVRKYDEDGVLIWELPFIEGTFQGPSLVPVIADLEFDRFGYAYVAIGHVGPTDLDWWVTKFHP